MGIYINMEIPEDSDMIVIYSDGTARKYLSYTNVRLAKESSKLFAICLQLAMVFGSTGSNRRYKW